MLQAGVALAQETCDSRLLLLINIRSHHVCFPLANIHYWLSPCNMHHIALGLYGLLVTRWALAEAQAYLWALLAAQLPAG